MSERITISISKEEFDATIEKNKNRLIIQYVGLSYGSMIYFMMNDRLLERDSMFELSLWGWHWHILRDSEEIYNSETITRGLAETALTEIMKGAYFEGVDINELGCILRFSNGVNISMKQHLEKEDGQDLFLLSLPDSNSTILFLTNDIPPQFKAECKA